MPGSCCSPFETSADQNFNQKKAAQELKRYRDKGPGQTTRLLVDGIAQAGALGGTVLDIGSGVGGLTLALLKRGASSAIAVDASNAYLDAARDEAGRQGQRKSIQFVHGDFVAVAPQLPTVSAVVLDRVVCCYPSCERLLDAALGHAERCLALSYPREAWFVRVGMGLENAQRWLGNNSFRTFVHPISTIEETIKRAGFKLSSRQETWMWSADVWTVG